MMGEEPSSEPCSGLNESLGVESLWQAIGNVAAPPQDDPLLGTTIGSMRWLLLGSAGDPASLMLGAIAGGNVTSHLFSVPLGWTVDVDLLADLVSARLTELDAG